MSIYMDFNSSAPIKEDVLKYMIEVYRTTYGNADSRTHDYGDNARKVLENARNQVATILNVKKEEVFFTSGSTESNNIALQGLKEYAYSSGKKHIITSSIEHKSILETAKELQKEGFEVDFVKPDISGRVSENKIISKVREDTLIVSLMHVNNETGVIQPVKEIGEYLAERNIFFHIDATQSFGKLVEELQDTKYTMLSMSAHKIGGPQGVGALILKKKNYKLPPIHGIMYGGQQEHGIRPGTTPVALAAGLGKACELARMNYMPNNNKCEQIKQIILEILEKSGLEYQINGSQEYCISNTLNISITGVSAEALMLASKEYCAVSNGSACDSKSYKPSFVLSAMGIPVDQIENSIRISWGPDLNQEDVCNGITKLISIAKGLVW